MINLEKLNRKSARPPPLPSSPLPYKKTCPCTIIPPPCFNFSGPPLPREILKFTPQPPHPLKKLFFKFSKNKHILVTVIIKAICTFVSFVSCVLFLDSFYLFCCLNFLFLACFGPKIFARNSVIFKIYNPLNGRLFNSIVCRWQYFQIVMRT